MSEYVINLNDELGMALASFLCEEVVRCRDCIQCDFLDSYCSKPARYVCSNFEYSEVALDGFCAWGERRND